MKKKLLFKTIYILFICLLSASLVFSSSALTVNENYYEGLYSFIDMMYRNELGIDEIMGSSLNGVLDGMSQYSCFEISYTDTGKSLSGIGANLEKVRDGFIIVSVNPSSPAYKAGLKSGDIIYRIDKQNTSVMGINQFKSYLAEKESVLIEIISRETRRVTAVRFIPEPDYRNDVDYVILDDAGYIRINAFSETTADIVKGILGSLDSLEKKEIILDLRDLVSMNIESAADIAGLLSTGGTIARVKSGTLNVKKHEVDFNVKILVNEMTIGAGEVIAASVPAVIYGQTTAGQAYFIRKYPVLTEKAYVKYSQSIGVDEITIILNNLKARGIELDPEEISGYLNLVESGVYNSMGKLISKNARIEPDVVIEDTKIGYMDYIPSKEMIEIRRDYSEGSVNYDIYKAKSILLEQELFDGPMTAVFGKDMTNAVNKYKSSVGYPVDGVLDMSTQAMLNTYSMKTAVLDDKCVQAALSDID